MRKRTRSSNVQGASEKHDYSENTLGASAETFSEQFEKINNYESTKGTEIGSHLESTTANDTLHEPFCFEEIKMCMIKLRNGKPAGLHNIFLS